MIGILINLLILLVPGIIYLLSPASVGTTNVIVIFSVVAVIYTAVNIGVFCSAIYNQIEDIEKITEARNRKTIFERQRDELISHATLYLGEKFPEHERELFKLIAEKNSQAVVNLLSAFPEIKSADMLKDLVKNVQAQHGKVYYEERAIEELKRKIRIRKRNPYTLGCLIPTYEE